MPTAAPSDVVQYLERWRGADNLHDRGRNIDVSVDQAGACNGVVNLVRAIPDELLLLVPEDRTLLQMALSMAEVFVARAKAGASANLGNLPGTGRSVIRIIWECMSKCPDEAPLSNLAALGFIPDREFAQNVHLDISAAHRALASDSYKAATVLAGEATETLLLWALQQPAVFVRLQTMPIRKPPAVDAELAEPGWGLSKYIDAAEHAAILKPDTCTAARLAANYRNLIHPGRAQRLGEKCDRGTALGAVGAMFRVIGDLEEHVR
jgi:hypothetical protein